MLRKGTVLHGEVWLALEHELGAIYLHVLWLELGVWGKLLVRWDCVDYLVRLLHGLGLRIDCGLKHVLRLLDHLTKMIDINM